jgi:hypothetical protein
MPSTRAQRNLSGIRVVKRTRENYEIDQLPPPARCVAANPAVPRAKCHPLLGTVAGLGVVAILLSAAAS